MTRLGKVHLMIAFFALSNTGDSAIAATDTWREHRESAAEAIRLHKYQDAKTELEKALKDAELNLFQDDRIAESLSDLGRLHAAQGLDYQAEQYFKKALEQRDKTLPPTSNAVATNLEELSTSLMEQRKFDQAKPYLERLIDAQKKAVLTTSDHERLDKAYCRLYVLQREQHHYAKAKETLESLLVLRKTWHGENSEQVADVHNDLARINKEQHLFSQAATELNKALAIRKTLFGAESVSSDKTIDELATLDLTSGDFKAARPLYEESLKVRKKLYQNDDPRIAQTLDAISKCYAMDNKLANALDYATQARSSWELAEGANSAVVASSCDWIARLKLLQKDLDGAIESSKKALSIRETMQGKSTLEVARNLGDLAQLYSKAHHTELAVSTENQKKEILKKLLGIEKSPAYEQSSKDYDAIKQKLEKEGPQTRAEDS
ncbi:MAG: tetratricopeptide repeat protein [Cyanobacteria bacterium]|nr:tetratricopeptide repeat protein [Cyanobacteriota bacterium]